MGTYSECDDLLSLKAGRARGPGASGALRHRVVSSRKIRARGFVPVDLTHSGDEGKGSENWLPVPTPVLRTLPPEGGSRGDLRGHLHEPSDFAKPGDSVRFALRTGVRPPPPVTGMLVRLTGF